MRLRAPPRGQHDEVAEAVGLRLRGRHVEVAVRVAQQGLAKHSGKTVEDLQRDSDRDFYMTAEQAKDYGLVDHVVLPKPGRA
ncbi:MAG: ClpP family protease, partial [Verrucomicrobiota bacterium]